MRRRLDFTVHYTQHRVWGHLEELTMGTEEQAREAQVKAVADGLDEVLGRVQECDHQAELTAVYDALEALQTAVDALAGSVPAEDVAESSPGAA
jgi:hypothetical protein